METKTNQNKKKNNFVHEVCKINICLTLGFLFSTPDKLLSLSAFKGYHYAKACYVLLFYTAILVLTVCGNTS